MEILSIREYRIIKLYFYYGYVEREIAVMLELNQSTVNRLKHNALGKLRVYLQK